MEFYLDACGESYIPPSSSADLPDQTHLAHSKKCDGVAPRKERGCELASRIHQVNLDFFHARPCPFDRLHGHLHPRALLGVERKSQWE